MTVRAWPVLLGAVVASLAQVVPQKLAARKCRNPDATLTLKLLPVAACAAVAGLLQVGLSNKRFRALPLVACAGIAAWTYRRLTRTRRQRGVGYRLSDGARTRSVATRAPRAQLSRRSGYVDTAGEFVPVTMPEAPVRRALQSRQAATPVRCCDK